MKNKDQHHYDRKGKYIGKSSETGPYAWIGKIIGAFIILYLLSKLSGSH